SVSGAASYTWYNNSNANNIVVYPVSATSFSVIGSSLGCSSIAQNSVAVKQVPVVSFNTFSITCGSLGSATAIINGGIGPFTHTWFPTSQTSTIANGLFPGTYTIEILDLSTGCTIRATENFLPLVPLTGTVTATPSLVCPGDQTGHASIQLSGGSGTQQYFWTDVHGVQ